MLLSDQLLCTDLAAGLYEAESDSGGGDDDGSVGGEPEDGGRWRLPPAAEDVAGAPARRGVGRIISWDTSAWNKEQYGQKIKDKRNLDRIDVVCYRDATYLNII